MIPAHLRSSCRRLLAVLPIGLTASLLAAATPQALAAPIAAPHRIIVELVGDSTQTDNAGYGRGFCANLSPQIGCVNTAHGGASTKTFRADGHWAESLAVHPDYLLIQFGHNDMESPDHLPRQTTLPEYEANLRRYIDEARAAGIHPILVTPITRRYYEADGKIHSDLLTHAAITRRVAASMHVPLIDLQRESITYLDRVGPTAGNALGITKKDVDGKTILDKTHLNWEGSYVFGRMVAVDLGKEVPALQQYVLPNAATLPPEGQLAMRVFHQEPFKIVLVGDSTVATGGGWGPGFCATLTPNVTCVDLAQNGRSSKSYIAEGWWAKALAEHGQYYFIQFGHNDGKPDLARRTDPETTFKANLEGYVRDVRAIGGIPILVTSLTRRNFKDGVLIQDDLAEYAKATREVAAEQKVTLVDLYSLSRKLIGPMTQAQADDFDATSHPDQKAENGSSTKPDRTHLNEHGKQVFGRMVADAVIRSEVELGPNVIGLPQEKADPAAHATPTTAETIDRPSVAR